MLNKDKIVKVEVLDSLGRNIVTCYTPEFQKDYFTVKGTEFLILKGPRILPAHIGDKVDVIFFYLNGARLKYSTVIDLATDKQVNVHIGESYTVMEERRRYFKTETDLVGKATSYIREDTEVSFGDVQYVRILNINLGGVFLTSNFDFQLGDRFMLTFLDNPVTVLTEILRLQKDTDGNFQGYGCRFLDLSHANEEIIARFIFECQIQTREKRKRLRNS